MARHRHFNSGGASKGFTLLELMVCIGIVTLLIALFMRTVTTSRKRANEVGCMSNLRQLGLALTMYVSESGWYPGCQQFVGFGNPRTFAVWPTRLRALLNTNASTTPSGIMKIFHCPSDMHDDEWRVTYGSGPEYATKEDEGFGYKLGEKLLSSESTPFSYGYNDWGAGPNGANDAKQVGLGGDIVYPLREDGYGHELRASRVRSPASMIAITDSTTDRSFDFNIDPGEEPQYPGRLHRGGCNVLFCDDHVQWFLQVDLLDIDPATAAGEAMNRMWNCDNQVHHRME